MSQPADASSPVTPRETASAASVGKQTALGAMWLFGQTYGGYLINFVVGVALARLLDPADFGALALAESLFASLNMLTAWGFGAAILTRPSLDADFLRTTFSLLLLLPLGILVATAGIALGWSLTEPLSAKILAVLAVFNVLLISSQMPRVLLEREMAFRQVAMVLVAAVLAEGGTALGLALLHYGVWSLVAGRVAGYLTQAAGFWLLSPWKPHFGLDRDEVRRLYSYGRNLFIVENLTVINARFDDLTIGLMVGKYTLGLYSKSFALSEMLGQTIAPRLGTVVFPAFTQLRDEPERLSTLYEYVVWALARMMIPYSALTIVLAPELVELVFGAKWLPMVPFLRVLVIYGSLLPVMHVLRTLLYALKRERSVAIVALAQTVLFMPGVLISTLAGGAVYTAWVVTVTTFLSLVWQSRLIRPEISVDLLRTVLAPLVVGGLAAFATAEVKQFWLRDLSLLPVLLLGSSVYAGAYAIGMLTLERRQLTLRLRVVRDIMLGKSA